MKPMSSSDHEDLASFKLDLTIDSLRRQYDTRHLSPLTERHVLDDFPGFPETTAVGWIRTAHEKHVITLGLFLDKQTFIQLALADQQGRVFVGNHITPQSLRDCAPDLSFIESDAEILKNPSRFFGNTQERFMQRINRKLKITFDTYRHGNKHTLQEFLSSPVFRKALERRRAGAPYSASLPQRLFQANMSEIAEQLHKQYSADQFRVITGDIVFDDNPANPFADNVLRWVGSWIRIATLSGPRYTLEQLRVPLNERLRCNLNYPDAITVAFFATCFIPQMLDERSSFGSHNIFRRLQLEAPLGAIRRSVHDTNNAQHLGLRVSGLERYFEQLMLESGALEPMRSLEAVHGLEPLHIGILPVSQSKYLAWDGALEPSAALKVLRIEGALNRFEMLTRYIHSTQNSSQDDREDTISEERGAVLDEMLVNNPAYSVLASLSDTVPDELIHNPNTNALIYLYKAAQNYAQQVSFADQQPEVLSYDDDPQAAINNRVVAPSKSSEWLYRKTLATLIRRIRLPFRFDTDFRVNLQEGSLALALSGTSKSIMLERVFNTSNNAWEVLDDMRRSKLASAYNLRLGVIFAVLAFAVDDNIHEVSIRLDSIGLEETVAKQNRAIDTLLNRTLHALTQMNSDAETKGNPKDGGVHGESLINGESTLLASAARSVQDIPETEQNAAQQHDEPHSQDETNAADQQRSQDFAAFTQAPTMSVLATVTFSRTAFLEYIRKHGFSDPFALYHAFGAQLTIDNDGSLQPVEPSFDLHDSRFAPHGSQEEPEFSGRIFNAEQTALFATKTEYGLSIQREDILQHAINEFHRIQADEQLSSVQRARQAMCIIEQSNDPELHSIANDVTRAMIDGEPLATYSLSVSRGINMLRTQVRDMLVQGQVEQAIETYDRGISEYDHMFNTANTVSRYFNSYAERVVYNHLFATDQERTLLIPDTLFYAHMDLADLLLHIDQNPQRALQHLNQLVAYAPTYPAAHMRLAVQLAQQEDWASVRAACLNALIVCLDRDDAAFAYYRLAYASWMRDEFAIAVACYRMADMLMPEQFDSLRTEMLELVDRSRSQCVRVPMNITEAYDVLNAHSIPVWPHTPVEKIVQRTARESVDAGMFVLARTLSVAAARMSVGNEDHMIIETQFLRSLSA